MVLGPSPAGHPAACRTTVLPDVQESRTPEVSTPAQAPAVESTLEDRQRKRAQLQTFANLGG